MAALDGANRNFGVVFFDDEKEPGAAWISVGGGQARRVNGPNELATDVIWWTNMSYEGFFKRTETWKLPWLRHDKYLVVSPKEVLQEWGLDPRVVGADYAAVVVSTMFARIMTLAFRLVREVEPRAKMDQTFVGKTLRNDLRRLMPEVDYPKGDAAEIMKSGSAYSEFTSTSVRGIKGARWMMLRRPRLAYAHDILQTPVPKAPFEFLGRGDLRSKGPDRVRWLLEAAEPCMAEIAIQKIDGDIAPVYAFGNATDQNQRVPRNWVAHPELAVLAKFAEIDVKSVWVGKEYGVIAPRLPEAVKDFLSDKHSEFSWTAGIIAETLWRAAGLAEEKGRGGRGDDEDRAHTSWQGAWLRAADKSAMFLSSMQLTEMGYAVRSYGLGWIRVMVPEESAADLIKDGLSIGLIPQLVDVPEGAFSMSRAVPWGGDQRSQFLAQMTAAGNRTMLWNLDKLPLLDKAERNSMLQGLIQASRRGKL